MATKPRNSLFVTYDKSLGMRLMAEAKSRGMTRTALIKTACDEYLQRNPIEDKNVA